MSSVFLENYECLQKWGVNTHSFLSLYPNVEHFTLAGVEGYIPYVETPHLVLVAGDPIAPDKSILYLIGGLLRLTLKKGKRLGMIPCRATNREFLERIGFDAVYIGKEPIFDLKNLPKLSKSNRQAVNLSWRKFAYHCETQGQQDNALYKGRRCLNIRHCYGCPILGQRVYRHSSSKTRS